MGGLSAPGAARLGILGGTFDPPHRMHVALARAAIGQLRLTRVLFIPAGDPWRKAGARVGPAADRLAMARLAVAGAPDLACSDMELRRDGPTYTLDTLAALRAQAAAAAEPPPLWFIVGGDALADLPNWHEPERIIALARLAVAARPGAAVEPAALDALVPGLAARVDWLALPADPLSATALRRRIAAGGPVGDAAAPAVVEYARRRGLYAEPDP
jgi:nicotinate-nucleotide adenylyltransferase